MAARTLARVVISFGMVNIGIKLFVAASAESVTFNMINPKTNNRVKQKLVDAVTGAEVERGDMLKGYEYAKDQFVCFTEDEVANMQAAKRDSLDITEFVDAGEIDPLHVERTYYTGPDKGMDKGYRLVYEMLKTYNKVAIGTWVARGKEHLVAISAYQHGLIMQQMFYDTEVRSFENTCANIQVSPTDLALGKVLMDTMSQSKFDSSKYSDKFVEKLQAAIQLKLDGKTITATAAPVSNTGMADALRASLIAMKVPADQIDAMLAKAGVVATASAPAAEPLVLTPTAAEVKQPKRSRATKKAS